MATLNEIAASEQPQEANTTPDGSPTYPTGALTLPTVAPKEQYAGTGTLSESTQDKKDKMNTKLLNAETRSIWWFWKEMAMGVGTLIWFIIWIFRKNK